MKIKDIVNRDIVNLDNCEQEPIHIPGSIQPNGFLIAVKEDTWVIDFCSANVEQFIGLEYKQLLNAPFPRIFNAENEARLKAYLAKGLSLSSTPFELAHGGKKFLCTVHKSGNVFIIEAEPAMDAEGDMPDTYEQTKRFLHYMSQTSSLKELCASVANGTREITGYDRVMIYRFDEQYNGEVFAESKREDLEPFLGLHYPHTDIPAQARELYLKNLLRIITDINYTPVPLYTIDDSQGKNLDLSLCVLRSTSPIHVQYLQNMGVGATLTISLIHHGKLWGLIACHHYSAKNLSHPQRIAAQLQGHFITSQIDVRQINEQYDITRRSNQALEKLLSSTLGDDRQHYRAIVQHPHILELCNANGVCICVNDELYTHGKVPPDDIIRTIMQKLEHSHRSAPFHTTRLSRVVPEVLDCCDTAAGLIYQSLSLIGNDCIMWFRGETVSEVHWAGDPQKAIVKNEQGLHPRKSFALWKEIVKCKSRAWVTAELNTAANYAHTLQKHVTYLALVQEEEKYRKLSETLKESNSELENINWISTHDLQEPLRKIQMMASRALSPGNEGVDTTHLVQKMNDSARRMQTLLKDILAYTKVRSNDGLLVPVELKNVIAETVSDYEDAISGREAKVEIDDMPEIVGIEFLLKQLFSNLLNNALKFTDTSRPQVISVKYEMLADAPFDSGHAYHKISVADTGIGFDGTFSDSIFKIFTRLNNKDDYDGSGVGLALCKKIMQLHNGYIAASGVKGEGARFDVYFPVVHDAD